MKKIIILVLLLFSVTLPCFAEAKEIITEGTYIMGDGETPLIAEERALFLAKRNAIEQAGTYIESYSQTKNWVLTQDEVNSIASGIIETTVLQKQRNIINNGISFYVKAKCMVNTDNIESMHNKLQDKATAELLAKVQNDYEKSMQEIVLLKKQLDSQKTQDSKSIELKIRQNENRFAATKIFLEAEKYSDYPSYRDQVIASYSEAIKLNPEYAEAYASRGLIYFYSGKAPEAINDFNKAFEINPDLFVVRARLIERGIAYVRNKQYSEGIRDLTTLLKENPNNIYAYTWRASAYYEIGQYQAALEDCKKYSEIEKTPHMYYLQGLIYEKLGLRDLAITSYREYINTFYRDEKMVSKAKERLVALDSAI
ncbi:MAG: tetratricopeptide repeat protein [Sporomusaceae bacterium]|nr:tetratricopeptide repeat protein [Sporomusaceae bacterium]